MLDALRARALAIRQAGHPEMESTGTLHEEPAPCHASKQKAP
jgi:hypothetical protein